MYYLVYKGIIPLILLTVLKKIIYRLNFEVLETSVLYVVLIGSIYYALTLKRIFCSAKKLDNNISIYNLILIPISIVYIFSDKFTENIFINFSVFYVTVLILTVLVENYSVYLKKQMLFVTKSFLYLVPITPFFYNNLKLLDSSFSIVGIHKLIIFLMLILPTYIFSTELKVISKTINKKYSQTNTHMNFRFLYVVVTIILYLVVKL